MMLLKCLIVSLRYIRMNRRDPVRIYNPHFVHALSFLLRYNSQIGCKITAFGHPHYTEYWMLWFNESHPLLHKFFITLLRCIRMIIRASVSICKHLMVNTVSYLLKTTLKIHAKCQSLGTPYLKECEIMCCKDSHPLLLECLIPLM